MAKKTRRLNQKPSRRKVTLARPKTETIEVVVPSLEGKSDESKTQTVERVVHPLTHLYNRKNITQIQYAAGDRYRLAFEMTSASMGGASDYDRVRGSQKFGGMAIDYLTACKAVSDAKLKILYPRDFAVMHRVCVEGKTFDQVARELTAMDLGVEFEHRQVAYMFKAALSQMAAFWWPDKVPKIDQATMEHLEEDGRGSDRPVLVEYETPEWDRVQHYRLLKGMPPLVPMEVKIGDDDVRRGAWIRRETANITAMVTERAAVTDVGSLEQAGRVAHATRERVFWGKGAR